MNLNNLKTRIRSCQVLILTRHFFERLFRNDLISFEDQMAGRIIGVVAILSVFFAFLASMLTGHYVLIEDTGTSWQEKLILLSAMMLVMALVSVIEWDALFLDDRDFANFAPLPIKIHTLFWSKFLSLCTLAGIFAIGMNIFAAVVLFSTIATYVSTNVMFTPVFFLIHFLATFTAAFFTLFFFAALVGTLSLILGKKLFTKVSGYIRGVILSAAVFFGYHFLIMDTWFFRYFAGILAVWREESSMKLLLVPPMWFIGLYETLLGNPDPVFHRLSAAAWLSILVALAAFYITAGLSFRRHLRKFGAAAPRTSLLGAAAAPFFGLFNRIFLRRPGQRAVFYFYGKTIRFSQVHCNRLIGFLAAGGGLILITLLGWDVSFSDFTQINRPMLAVPLVFNLFLILGVRNTVNVPAGVESNWIFRVAGTSSYRYYVSGLRKGIFFFNILPVNLAFLIVFALLWDWGTAFYHFIYVMGISALLMEGFFLHYRKIPFACSYMPGKEKFHVFLLPYIAGFVAYYFLTAFFAQVLLSRPSYLFVYWGVILVVISAVRLYQKHYFYPRRPVLFEEILEPYMVTLESYPGK